MRYGLRDQKGWTEVILENNPLDYQAQHVIWVTEHKSTGRFHYQTFNNLNSIRWEFELAEDAVLFALKFK